MDLQVDACVGGGGPFGDVVETSAALRANMVAEGCAATNLFLDVLSHLSPLQQARLSLPPAD